MKRTGLTKTCAKFLRLGWKEERRRWLRKPFKVQNMGTKVHTANPRVPKAEAKGCSLLSAEASQQDPVSKSKREKEKMKSRFDIFIPRQYRTMHGPSGERVHRAGRQDSTTPGGAQLKFLISFCERDLGQQNLASALSLPFKIPTVSCPTIRFFCGVLEKASVLHGPCPDGTITR